VCVSTHIYAHPPACCERVCGWHVYIYTLHTRGLCARDVYMPLCFVYLCIVCHTFMLPCHVHVCVVCASVVQGVYVCMVWG
jgi:hypothetical protein